VDLDRELHTALDVDPSPDFVARVRARVEHEPAPRELRLAGPLVALGIGVVVIAAMVSLAPDRDLPAPAPVARPSVQAAVTAPAAPVEPVQRPDRVPEVVANTSARAGLEALAVALQRDEVDLTSLEGDATFIPVEPMVVEVIPPLTDSEGVHQ
jgi:hypothetical protein